MTIHISKQTARRFLLHKQLLLPPQSLIGKQGIETVFNTLRLIQYDPLNPCGRNVDLVLQARVKHIHSNDYYQWLYKEHKGIECYDKELCVIPIEDVKLTGYIQEEWKRYIVQKSFFETYEQELEQLVQKIHTEGPLCSADIMDTRRVNLFWSESQWGRAALETLWKLGELVIVKRENGKKYYDIPQKVYGATYQELRQTNVSITEGHIMRRITSVGMLPLSGTGSGWLGVWTGKEINKIITTLIAQEKLIEVAVEGVKQRYVINANDKKFLTSIDNQLIQKKQIIFLAPLDNLLWDRTMIKNIFDFDYKWEVYTPLKQRKFGYYVLPILYGDSFIGRIEPVLNKDKNLEIKGFWQEGEAVWNNTMWKELYLALEKFKKYLEAKEIVGMDKITQ